jgi:hypothetical protein
MSLLQSIWVNQLRKSFLPSGALALHSVDESAFINYKTVIRPVENQQPTVLLDSTGNVVSEKLVDSESTYDLHNLRTTPTLHEDIDGIELSYPLLQNIVQKHGEQLNLKGTNLLLYKWLPTLAAAKIPTTGGAKESIFGATYGNKKKVTLEDFVKAIDLMDDMDIPDDGRYVCMPSKWYNQFLLDYKNELLDLSKTGKATMIDKDLEMLLGVKIYKRGSKNTPRYTGADIAKSPFAATATTDKACALFWHESCVSRAIGGMKFYEAPNANAQGVDVSARIRVSGGKIYNDEMGVVAVIESV